MSNNTKKTFENILKKIRIYLAVIAVILIILCIQNPIFIIPSIIVYGIVIAYAYWTNHKNKNELDKHIQELAFNVDTIVKNALINSPYPIVIVEEEGNVIWKSVSFVNEFANIDINNILKDILNQAKLEVQNNTEPKKENRTYKQTKVGKKDYLIAIEKIKTKSKNRKKKTNDTFVMYFRDNTVELEAVEKYEKSKICTGIIIIDSYDELLQSMGQEERAQVLTEIETKIYDWAAGFEGIVLKTERDRYVVIFEEQYLDKIIENKFEILGMAKDTETEGVIPTTLSIAIVAEGDSIYEKLKETTSAMDLVLGRGGDQAVVKRNGKYEFFGGKVQEVEKRTKVKARTIATALEELIEEAPNVLIMGHSNGDIQNSKNPRKTSKHSKQYLWINIKRFYRSSRKRRRISRSYNR